MNPTLQFCKACGGEVIPGKTHYSHDCWGNRESEHVPPHCSLCGANQNVLNHRMTKKVDKAIETIANIDPLIKAYDDYIELLKDELHNVVLFASNHGWKSSRYEKGMELREQIKKAKDALK